MNDSKIFIGCCGAYCKTCKPFINKFCKGCKIGYESGVRDLNRAKCKIKICCLKEKKLVSCADCDKFSNCKIFSGRFKVGIYDNKKYQEALAYININGYNKFILKAENWKSSSGKIK